jgi:hypothetical protein
MSLEEFISNINAEDLKQINEAFAKKNNDIPSFSFSQISFDDLNNFLTLKKGLTYDIFEPWFDNNISVDKEIIDFLEELIEENQIFINSYSEENLKVNFIVPLLNKVKFKSIENEFRDFYEDKLTYKTDKFIFRGTCDFVVAKGLFRSEKPYFFIQEFKKSKENSDPEPQLLAELISAIELNNWITIKGAFIVGAIWNFVILEKLGKDSYKYFVSPNFDSTKIDDLKSIYQNLLFVKEEIKSSLTPQQ